MPFNLSRIESPLWQHELRHAYTRPGDLLRDLALSSDAGFDIDAARSFAFRVPRPFAKRMQRGNPRDPLLLQVLPSANEIVDVEGFVRDPVADAAATRSPGLLQKYAGRALLIVTGGCAVNCRYCFRREFPYQDAVGSEHLARAVAAIAGDPSVHEIILSGGDPLTLSDARLAALLTQLAAIPHLRRLRIHSRLPVVLPSRITDTLLDTLRSSRLPCVMVVHANHAQEIDSDVRTACAALRDAGITVLNQTVLLRGINDDVEVLCALSEALFTAGVLPYYVHLLDRVRGTAHFEVALDHARQLAAELSARVPGYLLPRFVREIPGSVAKTPLN